MTEVSLVNGHIENVEHCVCCGEVIPEGGQFCWKCGNESKEFFRTSTLDFIKKNLNKAKYNFEMQSKRQGVTADEMFRLKIKVRHWEEILKVWESGVTENA